MAEKPLRKRIMKIKTDTAEPEDVKDPEACTIYQIFRGVAGEQDPRTVTLAEQYRAGGLRYGDAKQSLFELLMDTFGGVRERREALMADPGQIDEVLCKGAAAAAERAAAVMTRVRQAVGL